MFAHYEKQIYTTVHYLKEGIQIYLMCVVEGIVEGFVVKCVISAAGFEH